MKKYWKLLSITIIAVLAIGTFYIQKAIANENSLELSLDTVSGEVAELKGMEISGGYFDNYWNKRFTITEGELEFDNNDSFIGSLERFYQPKINQLIKDHRSFMRGKNSDLAGFYEDEQLLAYANVDSKWDGQSRYKDHNFEIDVLQKGENDRITFEQKVPNQQDYRYMYVMDVQVQDGQLSIFTRNEGNTDAPTEFRVYRFDIASEKLVSEDKLMNLVGMNGKKWHEGYLVTTSTETEPTENVVFAKTEMEEVETEYEEYTVEEKGTEYVAYNLSTMERKELNIPEEMSADSSNEFILGSAIYFIHRTEQGLTVMSYNLENQQEDEFNVDFPSADQGNMIVNGKGDRLYIVGGDSKELPITIVDVNTGETLYQGIYKKKGANGVYQLFSIDNIYIK